MKKSLIIAVALFLGVFLVNSTATEVTRFGPKKYVCEKGKPQMVTDTFSVYAGAGKIIVDNGEEQHQHRRDRDDDRDQRGRNDHQGRDQDRDNRDRDGDRDRRHGDGDDNHRVSSAIIFLNGKEVFGPRDFKRHVGHLEADVHLLKSNTLSVKVDGRPGSYLTITVIQAVTPPTVSITAAPDAIILGASATLNWTTTNADKVTIAPGIGAVDPAGSRAVTPQESTTYTITATNDGGTATASVQVTVYIPPTVTLSSAPVSIINGSSATLSWTSTNATSATIDQGIGAVQTSGTLSVTPTQTTTYTITVTGPGGTATATAQVMVLNPPTCHLSASPETITKGGSATLSWSSTNADTATIDQGIGNVPVSGSITVTPSQTTTYTITVTGPGGTATATAQVVVINRPTVQISASPGTITKGGSATLSWTSSYADSAAIDQGIGAVPLSGSLLVTPSQTTTYTITVTGPGGTATATAQVTVTIPLSTVTISVDPQAIQAGQSATLSWTSTNAEQATIDHGVGTVPVAGSITVTPNQTTTYTITVQSPGGQAQASATITVTNPYPTVEISADPAIIAKGGSAILSWSSMSVQSASIDNGVGTVPLMGSVTVYPAATTTYTITASGPLGVANAKATVAVQAPVQPQPEGSFGEQYQNLIPADSSTGTYDAKRFSLVTGLVKDQRGAPLAGVFVTILEHPEYGTAFTDGAGRYSLPVEGGSVMTVACQQQGLITAHRKVNVPWTDIAVVETMVMIPYDQKATTVTFDGNANTVVTHQSTMVSDQWGTRSATMVFTGDNQAYLVDTNGNTLQPLSTINVRATEFTTPASMPAKLPPNSMYTYCVDLTADGADRVQFAQPVITWVDNFLGFPVGTPVPVGYYDTARGVWVPSDNGTVVRLLDTNGDGIVDAYDDIGDGQPHGSVTGLNDPTVYKPGTTFWRFAVPHLTNWDANWGFSPPNDAIAPNPNGEAEADQQKENEKDCQGRTSSFVEERSRIFHEDIPIPGTDFTLHYTSNRVEGYKNSIIVPASGDTVPSSLKRIIVKVDVAGRTLEQVLNPLPNQKAEFVWDGLDQLGRTVVTPMTAQIEIGFVYNGVYQYTARFGYNGYGGMIITGSLTREEVTLWRRKELTVYPAKPKAEITGAIAKGWTLSAHHSLSFLDPNTLHKGDGTILKNVPLIITTIAGGGSTWPGDGGPATEAIIDQPEGLAFDAEGNLYVAENYGNRIRKIDTNGIITTVAGNGTSGYSGDGGPATEARLNYPYDVTVDANGNVYIADIANYRIRKVDTNGIITTVAGNGTYSYSGDGGPATEAQLGPGGIAVDVQGNLYILDSGNNRIRKVDTNGIITTVVGNGTSGYSGDGGPATKAGFSPGAVAVDTAGNLYIADSANQRIRKVDNSGIITTIAGSGNRGYGGDDSFATAAKLDYPGRIAVDAVGNLYIVDSQNLRIRKVNTSGIITTVAGNGGSPFECCGGDGVLAIEASLFTPQGIAVDALNNFYISVDKVRKVSPPAALIRFTAGQDIPFFDENGLGYIMTSSGRHKQTFDLDTGLVLYEFGYDDNKNLASVTDRFGNQTVITRDGNGVPRSITSPDGITTTLTIDGNNHLTAITYPNGSSYGFEYTTDGLMTAKIEPEGNRFEHTFNAIGRLTDATDEEGGHWQYARETYPNGDIQTEVLTAEGDLTTYLDHTYSTGAYTSTITDPTSAQTTYARSADGLAVNKNLPCGIRLAFKYDVDSEYKYQVVTGMWEDTPAGLERVTLMNKTYEDTNSDQVPDRITETVKVNGKVTALVTNTLAATKVLTSPVGRKVTTYYDPNTLLTSKLAIPGLYDTTYGYDGKGRMTAIKTNTRQTDFTYTPQGFLESIIDPENHTTWYAYDTVGRMTSIARPDGSSIGFAYDKDGNMVVLATPTDVQHLFGYNKVNLNNVYQAPISGQYQYYYDRDRRLTRIHFPSGLQIKNLYSNGRLTQIQTPEGNIDFTYLCGTKVGSVAMGSEAITYGYDGSLVTSEALSGTLNQTLAYAYNTDFNLTGFTYAGGTTAYTYDNDGLLTKAGAFTITRDAANGLPTAVAGGALNLTRAFNGYGELDGEGFTIGGYNMTSWALTRDKAGRITQKQEQVAGTTSNYAYTYDPMGRLLTVTKDGALVEQYQYGSNGARISEMNALRGIASRTMAYTEEDHMYQAGDTTYQYDVDGFLISKTKGSQVTQYSYSSRGELLQVKLPDTRVIDYYHDPLGRRIAKAINGVITEKYLWRGHTRLLAVYDGSNNLLMRFNYVDGSMPVTMTTGGSTYYLTYDQIGTLKVASDAIGNVVKQIDYDSFGNIISDTNPSLAIPFGFAGGLHDRDTGLVCFGFRDYDPDIGRWTSKDPIFFAGGDTDLYGYCLNDPVGARDILGLQEEIIIGIAVEIILHWQDEAHISACEAAKRAAEQEKAQEHYQTWLDLIGKDIERMRSIMDRLERGCLVSKEEILSDENREAEEQHYRQYKYYNFRAENVKCSSSLPGPHVLASH